MMTHNLVSLPARLLCVHTALQRSKQASISCPGGGALTLRLADYGEAIDFRDVTRDVANYMCGPTSCNLDITRFWDHPGKVLRVEWECACGAGNAPGRADENGACTPCKPGTYRTAGMVACAPCPPSSYQPNSGQVRCSGLQWGPSSG